MFPLKESGAMIIFIFSILLYAKILFQLVNTAAFPEPYYRRRSESNLVPTLIEENGLNCYGESRQDCRVILDSNVLISALPS